MGVAVIGYALAYSGVSNLDPCITPWGVPVSTMVALVPGAQPSPQLPPGWQSLGPGAGGIRRWAKGLTGKPKYGTKKGTGIGGWLNGVIGGKKKKG
jgi:hypothetical protein